MKAIRFLVSTIVIVILFTLAINVPVIYNQYTTTRKVCKVLVKYAQKNGGFMPSYDSEGNIIYANEKLDELLEIYDLKDKIDTDSITFIPELNMPVQKRDEFAISMRPIVIVNIPFLGERQYWVNPIIEKGYSHKYFK